MNESLIWRLLFSHYKHRPEHKGEEMLDRPEVWERWIQAARTGNSRSRSSRRPDTSFDEQLQGFREHRHLAWHIYIGGQHGASSNPSPNGAIWRHDRMPNESTPYPQLSFNKVKLDEQTLVQAPADAPVGITIPAHGRGRGGRKQLSAALPRVEVVHDLPDDQKICAADGTMLTRIGEEISEQLDYQPAKVRVIRNIRPKYACPCCKIGVAIAPVPALLLPKSLATPSLLPLVSL